MITIVPPTSANLPGYSSITSQIRIGAKTDSNRINKETSGDVKYLGPIVRRQVASAIKAPCMKNKCQFFSSAPKGELIIPRNKATPRYAIGIAGIIDTFLTFLTAVKAAAYANATYNAQRSPFRVATTDEFEPKAITPTPQTANKIAIMVLLPMDSLKKTKLKIDANTGVVARIKTAFATVV